MLPVSTPEKPMRQMWCDMQSPTGSVLSHGAISSAGHLSSRSRSRQRHGRHTRFIECWRSELRAFNRLPLPAGPAWPVWQRHLQPPLRPCYRQWDIPLNPIAAPAAAWPQRCGRWPNPAGRRCRTLTTGAPRQCSLSAAPFCSRRCWRCRMLKTPSAYCQAHSYLLDSVALQLVSRTHMRLDRDSLSPPRIILH